MLYKFCIQISYLIYENKKNKKFAKALRNLKPALFREFKEKVLVDSYDVAYKIEMTQKKKEIKKAIKKSIRAKKGFEVGIADIIVKMTIGDILD